MTLDPPARGRPRSADRTEAILNAAHDLLRTQGYDNLRMQDVADQASSGLATIYRRWPTKQDLVAAALVHKKMPALEAADADADLGTIVELLAQDMGEQKDYIAGLMAAAREHQVLGDAISSEVASDMRTVIRQHLTDLIDDGPYIEFLVDAIPGVILLRAGLLNEDVPPEAYGREVLSLIETLTAKQE